MPYGTGLFYLTIQHIIQVLPWGKKPVFSHQDITMTWQRKRTALRDSSRTSQCQILPNIFGEPTRESIIDIDQLISGNTTSVASNLGGGWHGHLALTMTMEDYLDQTGHVFVPPHNHGD